MLKPDARHNVQVVVLDGLTVGNKSSRRFERDLPRVVQGQQCTSGICVIVLVSHCEGEV